VTRSDNYSPLQRNTLDGLSETAGVLYLRLCDAFEAHRSRANERRAFYAACDYEDKVGAPLDFVLRHNPVHAIDESTFSALSTFFAERWRNNFMDAK
jgi:hypothetical protein